MRIVLLVLRVMVCMLLPLKFYKYLNTNFYAYWVAFLSITLLLSFNCLLIFLCIYVAPLWPSGNTSSCRSWGHGFDSWRSRLSEFPCDLIKRSDSTWKLGRKLQHIPQWYVAIKVMWMQLVRRGHSIGGVVLGPA